LFIKNNEWAYDYLAEKGINIDLKRRKIQKYKNLVHES